MGIKQFNEIKKIHEDNTKDTGKFTSIYMIYQMGLLEGQAKALDKLAPRSGYECQYCKTEISWIQTQKSGLCPRCGNKWQRVIG